MSQDPTIKNQEVDEALMAVYTVRGPDALQTAIVTDFTYNVQFIEAVI